MDPAFAALLGVVGGMLMTAVLITVLECIAGSRRR